MKEDLVLKNKNKFHKIITWSFYLVGLCMLILIVYIGCCQDDGKFQKRKLQGYEVVSNVKYREIEDDTVSPGIRKEYLLELGSTEDNDRCIAFYLLYHFDRDGPLFPFQMVLKFRDPLMKGRNIHFAHFCDVELVNLVA